MQLPSETFTYGFHHIFDLKLWFFSFDKEYKMKDNKQDNVPEIKEQLIGYLHIKVCVWGHCEYFVIAGYTNSNHQLILKHQIEVYLFMHLIL